MKKRRGYAECFDLLFCIILFAFGVFIGAVGGCEGGKFDGAVGHYKGDLIVTPLPDGTFGVYTKEQIQRAKERNGGAK